jgi:hypothetical protein
VTAAFTVNAMEHASASHVHYLAADSTHSLLLHSGARVGLTASYACKRSAQLRHPHFIVAYRVA